MSLTQRWVPQSPHDRAIMRVLTSIRALSDAMDRMHSGMKDDMDMNGSDLAALRMLVMREQEGRLVSPRDIADHLRISTASTTKLLDRLTASGHIERRPHPTDRRARIVVLTQLSRNDFFRLYGERLRAMRSVAGEYGETELAVIARFLGEVTDALDPTR